MVLVGNVLLEALAVGNRQASESLQMQSRS